MKKRKKFLYTILFAVYLSLLIYFLFFAEGFREGAADNYRYNFIPFREIGRYLQYRNTIGTGMVVLNLVGNIIGFAPFGFFVPCLSDGRTGFGAVTLYALEFSVTVEILQLFTKVGCCDIDDVLLNTLGGVIGYLCYCVWRSVYHESKK